MNTVPVATPAAFAMSRTEVSSMPRSRKRLRAASKIASFVVSFWACLDNLTSRNKMNTFSERVHFILNRDLFQASSEKTDFRSGRFPRLEVAIGGIIIRVSGERARTPRVRRKRALGKRFPTARQRRSEGRGPKDENRLETCFHSPSSATNKKGPLPRGLFRCRGRRSNQSTPVASGRRFRPEVSVVPSIPAVQRRLTIGTKSRVTGPVNSCRGRPIFCTGSWIISFHWAIQPTVRAMAKITVNIDVGMPRAR